MTVSCRKPNRPPGKLRLLSTAASSRLFSRGAWPRSAGRPSEDRGSARTAQATADSVPPGDGHRTSGGGGHERPRPSRPRPARAGQPQPPATDEPADRQATPGRTQPAVPPGDPLEFFQQPSLSWDHLGLSPQVATAAGRGSRPARFPRSARPARQRSAIARASVGLPIPRRASAGAARPASARGRLLAQADAGCSELVGVQRRGLAFGRGQVDGERLLGVRPATS